MAITYRKATVDDIPAIRRVACLTWPHAYADVLTGNQVSYMLDKMYDEQTLQQQMTSEGQQFFVAVNESGQVTGFAGVGPIGEALYKLHKLYVLPFEQQGGQGKQLLQLAEQAALSAGASRLQLAVNRNNKAKFFYEKMGFSIAAQGDFDIGAGFFMNDYIMEKQLS